MINSRGQNFGPKNRNIWSKKQVEMGEKSGKVGTCDEDRSEADQKVQRKHQKEFSLSIPCISTA